ncbi:MMPL family transporter [Mycobacterium sp. CVI_P3]|uniref:MMPL family transporter n=1 Tax=Mycobacterium pinniadriaticum TaxID=2994102 RepID=A0ABT3SGA9_9MYCO|nr:MMPL family transporter [Mycobacterium pinniadriaticum]MCX2932117.1 MMPL family transporter [Mycobacterium pinniadriaticum]MCX2938541.1 MMPL family transporter [Mycobacterium pinniadriaticum]
MLAGIARVAIRAPRRMIGVALLVLVGTAVFGVPVAGKLSAGGLTDPGAQSSRARSVLAHAFGQGDMPLLITVSSADGVDSPAARTTGTEIVRTLTESPSVATVSSPWTVPPPAAAPLISKDGTIGVIVAGITGGDNGAPKNAEALIDRVVYDRDGVTVRAGGEAAMMQQITLQSEKDLKVMEGIAIPLSFLVLVWVFGGLVAASLPVAVGAVAIFGAMAALHVITFATDVSIYALNLAVALGLALAIDYTLLLLSRFRDERAAGADRDDALMRTMVSAGRTVLFSSLTVALSMSAMVLFPIYALKSFGYAGVAVVAFASLAAIFVTPAAIVLLGERLDALDPRRWLRRPVAVVRPVEDSPWYRLAMFSMRRAVPIGVVIVALLLALGAPFLGVKWGVPDDRVLPTASAPHLVGDQLRTQFNTDLARNLAIVIPDANDVTPAQLDNYAAALSRASDVSSVSAPGGTFVAGAPAGPPTAANAVTNGSAFLTVASTAPLYSAASGAQLDQLQAVPAPAGTQVLIGGTAQVNRDTANAIASRLGVVLAIIAGITFVLLFLMTGSVVVPLKALILNVLSLTAAFGALVWIFQDGNLDALGTMSTGTLAISIPVLLFCIAFGLSMDYEVFLVSRIREFWLASEKTTADNDRSVALGLARTARVITAAALIMAITFAALAGAQVSFLRMLGVGLTLAVLADATLVRVLLVPAFMHVMGRFNWWAPKSLVRLHERVGIREAPHA